MLQSNTELVLDPNNQVSRCFILRSHRKFGKRTTDGAFSAEYSGVRHNWHILHGCMEPVKDTIAISLGVIYTEISLSLPANDISM